jgi:hypothetical protein
LKKKKVNIVFEGVMTDAEVMINGKPAGPVHQGAFHEFKHDISKLLNYGARSNMLEVRVLKHSADSLVNEAERWGDYWVLGGIFRPVYLEALPADCMERIATDNPLFPSPGSGPTAVSGRSPRKQIPSSKPSAPFSSPFSDDSTDQHFYQILRGSGDKYYEALRITRSVVLFRTSRTLHWC